MPLNSIGHVEVVGKVWMLAGNGRYALHGRQHAQFLTMAAHGKVFLFHVARGVLYHEACYLEIREAEYLCLSQYIGRHFLNGVVCLKLVLVVNDILELTNEPWIYLCQLVYPVNGISLLECLRNGEYAQVGRVGELLVKVVELRMVVAHKAVHALSDHSQSLLYKLLESASDRHYFSHRLHA